MYVCVCLEDQLMNSSANITRKRHNNIFLKSEANVFVCVFILEFYEKETIEEQKNSPQKKKFYNNKQKTNKRTEISKN